MLAFSLSPISVREAFAVCRWRWDGPFTPFAFRCGDEPLLLDRRLRYHGAHRAGTLAGFACFSDDAQVIGGEYPEDALDLGLGLAPPLVGQGLGRPLAEAVMAHATTRFAPALLRVTVAESNLPALRLFYGLGFAEARRFHGRTRAGEQGFVVLVR